MKDDKNEWRKVFEPSKAYELQAWVYNPQWDGKEVSDMYVKSKTLATKSRSEKQNEGK